MTAPLAWLIDTNVVSEMMRPRPEPRVAAFLDSIAGEGLGLSSITVWEILDGSAVCLPAIAGTASPTDSTIFSTNCSRTGSSTGPLSTPGRAHGSWKTSAGVESRSMITSRTRFSRLPPLPVGLPC